MSIEEGVDCLCEVVDCRYEHSSVEIMGAGQLSFVEETGDVVGTGVSLGVELGTNSSDLSGVGARRSGYHPPPFISCLAAGKGDEVSVAIITIILYRRPVLG